MNFTNNNEVQQSHESKIRQIHESVMAFFKVQLISFGVFMDVKQNECFLNFNRY